MTYDGVVALAHIADFVHGYKLCRLRAAGGLVLDLDESIAEGGVCEVSSALTQGDAVDPGAVGEVGRQSPRVRSTLGHVIRTLSSRHAEHVTHRRNEICDLDREELIKERLQWPRVSEGGAVSHLYRLNNRQSQNDVVRFGAAAGQLHIYGQGDVSSCWGRGRWSYGQISCSGFSFLQREPVERHNHCSCQDICHGPDVIPSNRAGRKAFLGGCHANSPPHLLG